MNDETRGDSPKSPQHEEADAQSAEPVAAEGSNRRGFLAVASSVAMAGGLAAGYGTLGVMGARFLYSDEDVLGWQYVARVDQLKVGDSMSYVSPSGANVVVARQTKGSKPKDFIALSSICPHLGCQVHWEPQNEQFFCPCHNGAFDAQGKATKGPPAQANPKQELKQFPIRVEGNLLYVKVPVKSITGGPLRIAQAECRGCRPAALHTDDIKEA